MRATPATQNDGGCEFVPRLPRETKVDVTWQAWHNLTSTVVLRGRRGTDGIGWRAWTGLGARDAAPLCVAGVAQPDIHLRFTWQAWHKLTSTVVLRGRLGTHCTGWRAWTGLGACDAATLCVAGVAQTHTDCRFSGRCGTHSTGWRAWTGLGARDAAALCVAGVAQTHTYCRFAWQAWHKLTPTVVSRGRRGTNSHILLSYFVTHLLALSHITFTFHFVTQNCFNFSILHHILCLSSLPRPRYNL